MYVKYPAHPIRLDFDHYNSIWLGEQINGAPHYAIFFQCPTI
jgi:hypothetical protein